jgi:hypothetical protein
MIINMTTFAGRATHYIDETMESLRQSDGRHLPVNLILGSSDTSHVEQYRGVVNIVPWDQEAESQTRKDRPRRTCSINAIRALGYGEDEHCLCCEDDVFFKEHWLSELMLTLDEIEGDNYVLNLAQRGRTDDKRYAEHTGAYLCGAQALFYPSRRLRRAVFEYVRENIGEGMNDDLIGRYAKAHAALYNIREVQVRHIGQVSSFHTP